MSIPDNNNSKRSHKSVFVVIIFTGLLAGLLDGAAAVIHVTLLGNPQPMKVFNYIASGIFGDTAFSGGMAMTSFGVLFHLGIATIWTGLFFLFYKVFLRVTGNWLILGILYGIIVWIGMNLVVLPLSNTPPRTFSINNAVIGVLILIICVGIPVAYSAFKFYKKN